MKISVAMATYNGARYLPEQLESLAMQTRPPDELVVCDDCSTDDTVSILQSFAARAAFPVRIVLNVENMGAGRNFMHATRLCEGDWIAFSDQDDVWLPKKLQRIEEAASIEDGLSLIVHLSEVTDKKLRSTGYTKPPWLPKSDALDILEYHPPKWWWRGGGHCLVFHSSLVHEVSSEVLPELPSERREHVFSGQCVFEWKVRPHDDWISLLAGILGRTFFIREVLVLHRRHDANDSIFLPLSSSHDESAASTNSIGHLRRAWLSGHYYASLHAAFASSFANVIEDILRRSPGSSYAQALEDATIYHRHLARWLRLRASIYEGRVGERAWSLLRLLASGGYLGGQANLGVRNLLKDLVICAMPFDRRGLRVKQS